MYDISEIKKDLEKIGKTNKKNNIELVGYDLFKRAFSQKNLEEILQIKNAINTLNNINNKNLFLLALISILEETSNIRKHGAHYRFINNNNIGVKTKYKTPPKISTTFKNKIEQFLHDISIKQYSSNAIINTSQISFSIADARNLNTMQKFDAVITSPPYLNRDNYVAQSKWNFFFYN